MGEVMGWLGGIVANVLWLWEAHQSELMCGVSSCSQCLLCTMVCVCVCVCVV